MDFNGNNKTQFLFILGTTRCGKKLIKCMLDEHPDILVWPEEFPYFTYFKETAGKRKEALISDLNKRIINTILPKAKFNYNTDHPITEKIFLGNLDVNLFIQKLQVNQTNQITPINYLYYLLDAFHNAHAKYKDKKVKYYAILCPGQGFDWSNNNILKESKFIFPFRNNIESYQSTREKRFNKFNGLYGYFSPIKKNGALYWMYLFSYLSDRVKENLHRDNFYILPLKELQTNASQTIEKLCKFLSIKNNDSLTKLTILGLKYQGNLQEKKLRQGVIISRSSNYSIPLFTYEKYIFNNMNLFDNTSNKIHVRQIHGMLNIFKSAFISSFYEIPINKIYLKKQFGNFKYFLIRSVIFLKFIIIYFFIRFKIFSNIVFFNNLYILAAKKKLYIQNIDR